MMVVNQCRPKTLPVRLLAACMLILSALGVTPAPARIVQQVISLPVTVTDNRGKPVTQPIQVTIYRDDAVERAGFLILNHGRSSDASIRAAVRPAQYAANAQYFVSKGFAVFVPVRIGYGITGGPDVENAGACDGKNYPPGFEAAAVETVRLIEYARTLPYIDPGNGLVVGQSYGGTTAVAVAARHVPGVRGAVNFAGGGGGRPDTHPGDPCRPDRMTDLFAAYGATAATPMLWLYSENDQYWGKDIPHRWFKAFVDHGGKARFVTLPPYKSNGHVIFNGNPSAWRPAFEAFLQSCCRAAADAVRPGNPPPAFGTEFNRILSAWAAKYHLGQAEMTVRHAGHVVFQTAIGGSDPNAPVLLASLSKAITGACVATLVRDGRLSFHTPLSQALARFFASHGPPADRRILRVTIAQLLTHRAGFPSADDGEDLSTNRVLRAYLTDHPTRETATPAYLAMVFAAGLTRDPGTRFAYANAGYLTLGAVIEEATGSSYQDYCRDAVLQPAGATGALDPVWRILGSYGGWRMTGPDYLAFYDQLDPGHFRFGARARDWLLDRTGKTYGDAGSQRWYGLGMRLRDTGHGIEYWHTGSWHKTVRSGNEGQVSGETSTYVAHLADGTAWFVHSTPLVEGNARNELDRALVRAYRAAAATP